jgi:tetratricopeptide (TPR) repeat protein
MYRALEDRDGQAVALNALGVTYHRMERYEEARRTLDQAVAIWRELGRETATVRALANMAALEFDAGNLLRSIDLYREARARCEEAGDEAGAAWAINGEARVEHFRNEPALAVTLYEDALRRFERIHDNWGASDSLLALGLIEGERGDAALSRERLMSAHTVSRRVGDVRGTLRVIEAAAQLAALKGRAERSLTLAGAAAAMRRTLNTPLPGPQQRRLEMSLDAMRGRLEPQQAGAAWMRGWSLTPDEAVSLAFGPGSSVHVDGIEQAPDSRHPIGG